MLKVGQVARTAVRRRGRGDLPGPGCPGLASRATRYSRHRALRAGRACGTSRRVRRSRAVACMGTGRREDAVQFVEQFAAGGDPLPAFGLGPAHQCARLGRERFGGRGRCESLRRDCGPRGDRVGCRSLRCRGLRRCSGFIPQCGPVALAAVGTDNFRLTGIGRRGRMREVGRTGRYRKTGGGRPEGCLRSGFGRVPGHEGSVLSRPVP